MRDLGNQIVLGTFVATFFYCLLILRAVRGLDDTTFVPNLSITIAVVMAVGSLAVLIYFIDHISRALQGPQVVAAVGLELERAINRPVSNGVDVESSCTSFDAIAADSSFTRGVEVLAVENGYLQAVDAVGLFEIAKKNDVVIHLTCRPGNYIMKGDRLLSIEGDCDCDASMQSHLVTLFFLGRQRTAEQDLEYSIRQLVEIAVRALSPGINDPFTAMNCIDWLGAAISAIAKKGLPSGCRCDHERKPRLIMQVPTFAGVVDSALNQIRQFGGDSVAVSVRLLEVIGATSIHLQTDAQRKVLVHHAEMVYRQSCEKIKEPSDLADVKSRYDRGIQVLGDAAGGLLASTHLPRL